MESLEILTQEKFFERFCPEERGIRISGDGKETFIPIGREIICDFCNDLITGVVHILGNSHALCETCGKKVAAKILSGEHDE